MEDVSDMLDPAMCEFLVHPDDVIYFCHDSASYMAPTAERLRNALQVNFQMHNAIVGPT